MPEQQRHYHLTQARHHGTATGIGEAFTPAMRTVLRLDPQQYRVETVPTLPRHHVLAAAAIGERDSLLEDFDGDDAVDDQINARLSGLGRAGPRRCTCGRWRSADRWPCWWKPRHPPRPSAPADSFLCRWTVLHRSTGGRSSTISFHCYGRRTCSGRPSSSIRFSAFMAIATSVVRRRSVRDRNPSPMTCLKRLMLASTSARQL